MRVWLPQRFAGALEGDAPAGVEIEVYDGEAGMPARMDEVEFLVPPFLAPADVAPLLGRMPKLRVVQALTAGVDGLRPHVPAGVTLCNARGVHDASTAEWVVGAILASLHRFPRFARAASERRWDHDWTDSLAGSTVLIVGYGSIGAAVERRLAGFEVEVLRVARSAREGVAGVGALPELLPRADVVIILVPVTEETRGLVDGAFLARMASGALLVNAARGVIVDTQALVAELASARLRAALDVTDPEPLPPEHPLWRVPGLLLTPHVGGATPVSARRAHTLVRQQLHRYVSGEPLHNVVAGPY